MLLQVEWQREQLVTLHRREEEDHHDDVEEVKESMSGGSQGLVFSGEWL